MARIWIVGGGLIGCGWAAAFAGAGHDTIVIDPDQGTGKRLEHCWQEGYVVLRRLGTLAAGAAAPRLVASAQEAGEQPDLVQECLPENLSLKSAALRELEPLVGCDTVIASSSSGLDPDDISKGLANPGRVIIAHPCNPPYLMSVVEISSGVNADPRAIAWADEFFTAMGKTVLKLRKPMPGHLVNRLQTALWREAVHLAIEGVASVGDIERAVTEGLAPRWCFVGPTGVFHLAGAEAGISGCIDKLGEEFERWWATLGAPRFDTKTRTVLAQGIAAHDPRPVQEIAALRDELVTGLLGYLTTMRGLQNEGNTPMRPAGAGDRDVEE